MIKLSIITINYNNKAGLEKTIVSVTSAGSEGTEFIVVDGDSTDGSKELLNKYASQINLTISEPDKGIYDAQNKGAARAKGDYLLFLKGGDIWSSGETL